MRILTTVIATSVLMANATMTTAGGLSPEIMPTPEPVVQSVPPQGSSVKPGYIVLGVLAALLIASQLGDDEQEEVIMASDARLKENITRIGTASNGLPLYSFSYVGDDAVFSGVMAQDVLMHTPQAVVPMFGGLYAVNYDMLGVEMQQLN
jgi:hypothetical protein